MGLLLNQTLLKGEVRGAGENSEQSELEDGEMSFWFGA